MRACTTAARMAVRSMISRNRGLFPRPRRLSRSSHGREVPAVLAGAEVRGGRRNDRSDRTIRSRCSISRGQGDGRRPIRAPINEVRRLLTLITATGSGMAKATARHLRTIPRKLSSDHRETHPNKPFRTFPPLSSSKPSSDSLIHALRLARLLQREEGLLRTTRRSPRCIRSSRKPTATAAASEMFPPSLLHTLHTPAATRYRSASPTTTSKTETACSHPSRNLSRGRISAARRAR